MLCNKIHYCEPYKLLKFKRKQQRLKYFNYCKKKYARDFWKELRRVERRKVRLKKASKRKMYE